MFTSWSGCHRRAGSEGYSGCHGNRHRTERRTGGIGHCYVHHYEYQDLSNASYTARDPEATGGGTTTIRWSTSGRGRGDFTIDRGAGVLTFRTPPDYERPADSNRENVYEVTVRAYDGWNYGDFEVTVTVLAVNEGPESPAETPSATGKTALQPSTPTGPATPRGMSSPGVWGASTPANLRSTNRASSPLPRRPTSTIPPVPARTATNTW